MEEIKIKNIARLFGRIGFRGYTTQDIVLEGEGAIAISPTNIVDNNFTLDKKNTFISWEKYYESPEIFINNGDILFVKTGSTVGKVAYIKNESKYKLTLNPQVAVFKNIKINKKYFYFVLSSKVVKEQVLNEVIDGIIPNISQTKILNFTIPQLSIIQQEKIANYLDTETSKIDRKVSILEQKFAKLEEYKQSVIFETVTKGLDNNVPMKDSGIDWIGKIPAHWEILRVKEVLNPLNKSDIQSGDSELDGIYDFYISGAKTKKINKTNLHQIALLLPTGGTYMVHFPKNVPCAYSTDVLPLVTKSLLNIKYGFYFLNANREYFNQSYFSGTGIKHLQREEFFNSLITIPSKNEQDEITCYLDLVCLKIDKKKEIIKKQIELLKEYKQTIIYEAVTGKKEIL